MQPHPARPRPEASIGMGAALACGLTALVACTGGPALESRIIDRPASPRDVQWTEIERFTLTDRDGPVRPVDFDLEPGGRLAVLDEAGPEVWIVTPTGEVADRWPVTGTGSQPFFRPRVIFTSGLSVHLMDPDERLILSFDGRGQYQGVTIDFGAKAVVGTLGFFRPVDADADEAGRVFVTDGEGDRVLVFGPGGEFLFSFGAFGSGLGQFRNPSAVTVADDGRAHVCDVGNRRVQHFDGFGTPLGATRYADDTDERPLAVTVSPTGDVLVLGESGVVSRIVNDVLVRVARSPRGTDRIEAGSDGLVYWLSGDRHRVSAVEVEGL